MPLYEYRCLKCGVHFEKIQKFSDSPLKTCEECGGKLERLLSSPAIQFKGSGWYVTDYARKGAPEQAQKEQKSEASKSDGSSAGKSQSSSPSDTKKTPEPSTTRD